MNPPPNSNHLLGFLRRRVVLLAAAFVVAAVGSYVLAGKLSGQTWACTATLLYNRSNLGEPYYRQPEAQSIVSLFKSRSVLETLAREFKLPPALAALANSIQAEIIFGSNTIQVTLRGGDPQRTRAMLDRMIQLVINQAAQLRRDAVDQILDDRRRNLIDAKAALDEAYRELDRFHASHRIVTDVEDDLQRIRDDIAAVERAAELDRPFTANSQDELQRRRSALQETLATQRDAIAREASLTLKRNEFERAARLHEKRYISDAEFRRIEAEYRTLEAQNAAALRELQERLAQVDQTINDKLDRTGEGASPDAEDVDPRTAAEAVRLQAFLQQRRAEAERLGGLRAQESELRQAVTTAQNEISRLSTNLTMFQEFRRATFDDLTIVQPAAPALDPVTSNKKKVLAGAFFGLLGVLVMPVLVWDVVRGNRGPTTAMPSQNPTAECVAQSARPVSGPGAQRREAVRALALRMQQFAPERSAAVLITRLDDSTPPLTATRNVAECLHRRGESVLIVDLSNNDATATELLSVTQHPAGMHRDAADDWMRTPTMSATADVRTELSGGTVAIAPSAKVEAGVAEWLLDESLELGTLIRRGEHFDALPFGQAALSEEAFAMRRLTAMFDELRDRYGRILVLGPDVTRQVDLELLAARVDAVAFVSEPGRSPLPAGERVWSDLVSLKAPLLGRYEV